MTSRISARLAALAASIALLAAACATSSASPTGGGASPAASAASMAPSPAASSASGAPSSASSAVTIQNFAFEPSTISVAVGGTVTWTNQDSTQHTVTADDNSFTSAPLNSGATFSQTFSKAGTYTYHCRIHPTMKATVTVG